MASTRMPVVRTDTPTTAAPSGFIIIARICRPALLLRIHMITAVSMSADRMMVPSCWVETPAPRNSTRPSPKIGGSGLFWGPKMSSHTCVPMRLMARVAMRLRVRKFARSCSGRKAMAPTNRPVTAAPAMPNTSVPIDSSGPSRPAFVAASAKRNAA